MSCTECTGCTVVNFWVSVPIETLNTEAVNYLSLTVNYSPSPLTIEMGYTSIILRPAFGIGVSGIRRLIHRSLPRGSSWCNEGVDWNGCMYDGLRKMTSAADSASALRLEYLSP